MRKINQSSQHDTHDTPIQERNVMSKCEQPLNLKLNLKEPQTPVILPDRLHDEESKGNRCIQEKELQDFEKHIQLPNNNDKEHIVSEMNSENRFLPKNHNEQARSINLKFSGQANGTRFSEGSQHSDEIRILEMTDNLSILSRPEVQIYLSKAIGLFLAIISFSIIFILFTDSNISLKWCFVIIQSFLVYFLLIDLFWTRRVLRDQWAKSENFTQVIDILTWSLTLWILYLASIDILPQSFFSCVPFMTLATASMVLSGLQSDKNLDTNFQRMLYCFYILLVGMKIDDSINIEWSFVFLAPWACLGIKSWLCFKYGFSFVKLFISFYIKRNQFQNQQNKTKIIGFLWCFMYYGLNLVGIFALIAIAKVFNQDSKKDYGLLNYVAWTGFGLSSILIIYTYFLRNHLIEFIILINLIRSYFASSEEVNEEKKISICIEKKDNYFIMLSPTYFVPLEQQSNLKENRNEKTLINFEGGVLGKERKITNASNINAPDVKDIEINTAEYDPNLIDCDLSLGSDKMNYLNEFKENFALAEPKEQNPQCYICYLNQPNIILFNCGHGGVCFNCISTLMKKKDECMECRQKVKGIYRINTNPVYLNIYKGYELIKIIT